MKVKPLNELKAFLVKKGIRQNVLAKKIHMHPTRLNSFLNGSLVLKDVYIEDICNEIGIDFDAYMDGEIEEVE